MSIEIIPESTKLAENETSRWNLMLTTTKLALGKLNASIYAILHTEKEQVGDSLTAYCSDQTLDMNC